MDIQSPHLMGISPIGVNIAFALAKAQMEFPPIFKTSKAYNYSYTPLGDIYDLTRSTLIKNDLCIVQNNIILPSEKAALCSTLIHKSGEFIRSIAPKDFGQFIPTAKQQIMQVWGSTDTYMRRYEYGVLLGLVSEEDTDGLTPTEKLMSLIEASGFDVKRFTTHFKISSKSQDTIIKALGNFSTYSEEFKTLS